MATGKVILQNVLSIISLAVNVKLFKKLKFIALRTLVMRKNLIHFELIPISIFVYLVSFQ